MCNAIPRPEHPRPDFVRPQWMNLNGEWQFAFDDANVGLAENWQQPGKKFDRTINVPFSYQSEMSGIGEIAVHPYMWYRRSFTVPAEMKGKRLLLRFGAVDYTCSVYVNGRCVGGHRGGYTPFALDITDYVVEGENDLCVHAEDQNDCTQPRGKQSWTNERFGCWYDATSGIWQTVYLEAAGSIYVKTAHVTPDIDQGIATLRLTLSEIPATPVKATIRVSFEGKLVREQSMTMDQRSQRISIDMIDGSAMRRSEVVTWSPRRPALYDMDIELDTGDQVHTYFGMRKVEVKDGVVLLNNRPFYQRMVLDQGYWPQSILTPPSDDAIREDVEWTKKFGYNGARKHQKLEDPRYYYWADKLGLLVWEEIPSTYEFTNETIAALNDTLEGAIERDYNHPCVITWVPINESWGVDRIYNNKNMQNCADMLYYQAKAMDGTRLVSVNDGWENTHTDIFGLHDYAATGEAISKHFADRDFITKITNDQHMAVCTGTEMTGKEALMVTEYGGIAFADGDDGHWGYHDKVKDEEGFFARYKEVTDAIRNIPFCWGYVYTQLTDVQQETNGLLTPDRKPKIDVERFASITINPDARYGS